jgi:hypothetical protein
LLDKILPALIEACVARVQSLAAMPDRAAETPKEAS